MAVFAKRDIHIVKKILYTSAAIRQRRKLGARVWGRIEPKLRRYAETGQGDVIRLSGRDGARLRVGGWRVLFTEDGETIAVFRVGHRRDVYERVEVTWVRPRSSRLRRKRW